MLVEALVSFAGSFSMTKGEQKDCQDEAILQDLLKAGYVKALEERKVAKDEGKRGNKRISSKLS